LEQNSTCFGQFLCPSSGVFHCTHSNVVYHTGLLTAGEQDQDGTSWSCPKHVEFYSKNKFEKLVHLVGFIIRIIHPLIQWVSGVKKRWHEADHSGPSPRLPGVYSDNFTVTY